MRRNCRVCGTEFEAKTSGIHCSDSCRRLYNRQWLRDHYKANPSSYLLNGIRNRSKEEGLPFDLVLEDIAIPEICPILGIKLYRNTGGNKPTGNSPSVDRVIPSLGYIKGNVQVISQRANIMKNDANPEELLKFAEWVNKNYKNT